MPPFVGPPQSPSAIEIHLSRQREQEEDDRRLPMAWKVAPVAASLFDAWTTQDALSRGGAEANPMMRGIAGNPALLFGAEAASGLLAAFLADRLAKSGHPNGARILSGLNVGAHVAAGANNLAGGR